MPGPSPRGFWILRYRIRRFSYPLVGLRRPFYGGESLALYPLQRPKLPLQLDQERLDAEFALVEVRVVDGKGRDQCPEEPKVPRVPAVEEDSRLHCPRRPP